VSRNGFGRTAVLFPAARAPGAAEFCGAPDEATCATDSWAASPPFESSHADFGELTLGLEAGAAAPLLSELGGLGQRTILTVYTGCVAEPLAALGLVAERADVLVIAALSRCTSSALANVRQLLGEDVVIVTNPLAGIAIASYWIGDAVAPAGITFLIDQEGTVVLRRIGSPEWLLYDDLAVPRAFAEGRDVTEVALAESILAAGEQAPAPPFALLGPDGGAIPLEEGIPRLVYTGPSPTTERGALIIADLDALRAEFPSVEFIWRISYKSDAQLEEQWKLFDAAGIAWMYPEWYELSLEEYMDAVTEFRDQGQEQAISEIRPFVDAGWRLALDPGHQLGILWGVRFSPSILVLDRHGRVALPFTLYPTNSSTGEYRVHPGAQDALRQILLEVAEG
jgi:hypothetical protein